MEYKVKLKYHWALANSPTPTLEWTTDSTDKKLFKDWKKAEGDKSYPAKG